MIESKEKSPQNVFLLQFRDTDLESVMMGSESVTLWIKTF